MKTFQKLCGRVWSFLEDKPPRQLRDLPPAAPVDLLVMDVSLSMNLTDYLPSRLEGAREAARHFLSRRAQVCPEARVGIVTFCWKAHLVSGPVPVMQHMGNLCDQLDRLSTDNATNISAGLILARHEILRVGAAPERRILLLTDGDANTGWNPVIAACDVKVTVFNWTSLALAVRPPKSTRRTSKAWPLS